MMVLITCITPEWLRALNQMMVASAMKAMLESMTQSQAGTD